MLQLSNSLFAEIPAGSACPLPQMLMPLAIRENKQALGRSTVHSMLTVPPTLTVDPMLGMLSVRGEPSEAQSGAAARICTLQPRGSRWLPWSGSGVGQVWQLQDWYLLAFSGKLPLSCNSCDWAYFIDNTSVTIMMTLHVLSVIC